LQKLFYSELSQCSKCGLRVKQPHPLLRTLTLRFLFSRYTQCVRCGTFHVQRSRKRDRIDSLSKTLYSLIQHILGAPLNKCVACRLQYYDWRRPWAPASEGELEEAPTPRARQPGD
jgi:hypothetical protein